MVKLDSVVKDKYTGFTGVAISRLTCVNGCVRIEIQAKKLKDGKPIDTVWIDESQLVGHEKVKPREGFRKAPPAMSTPK